MIAFTVGSLAAVLSVNFPMLLISRLFQAVGCGMLLSFAQIVLLKLYPKEKHGTTGKHKSAAAVAVAVILYLKAEKITQGDFNRRTVRRGNRMI